MFTKEEIQLLLQTVSSHPTLLKDTPSYIESTSKNGIFSRSHVSKSLSRYIDEIDSRTSVSEAAKRLDVDQKDVVECFPVENDHWAWVGQQIIGKKEISRLTGLLSDELGESVVEVTKFSRRWDISGGVFDKILRLCQDSNGSWRWLGTGMSLVCGEGFYEDYELDLLAALEVAQTPINLATAINPKYTLIPIPTTVRIATDFISTFRIQGTLSATTYTPKALQLSQQETAIAQLMTNGYIDVKSLKRAGIDKPDKYLKEKAPAACLLKNSYATREYIETLEANAMETLDHYGYCDFGASQNENGITLDDMKMLRDSFATKQKRKRKFQEIGNHLVVPELVERITTASADYASHQGITAWDVRLRQQKQPEFSATTWTNLLDFTTPSVPARIMASVMEGLKEKASEVFEETYEGLRFGYNRNLIQVVLEETLRPTLVKLQGGEEIQLENVAERLSDLSGTLIDDEIAVSALDDCTEQVVDAMASDNPEAEKTSGLIDAITKCIQAVGL